MPKLRALLLLSCMVTMAACESLPKINSVSCDGESWAEATFYFGRSRPAETEKTQKAWADFVQNEVTPRFPDGFTIFQGRGAWLNPVLKTTIYEASKVLVILHPDTVESRQNVADLAEAYRSHFHQQAALTSNHKTCATFHTGK